MHGRFVVLFLVRGQRSVPVCNRHRLCVPLFRLSLQGMSDNNEDELKLGFTLDAMRGPNPFGTHAAVHQDVAHALRWLADRSSQQVVNQRERSKSLKRRRML